MTRVKICGITRLEDALLAAELGADAIGLVFADSPRSIDPAAAAVIVRRVPALVQTVGVFHDAPLSSLLAALERSGVGAVQLHGDEPPDIAAAIPRPVLRRFRPDGDRPLAERLAAWPDAMPLLDPGAGDGAAFDWALAHEVTRPFVLAGGLTADNVGDALRTARPYGVDVSSGVESRPGIKCPVRMRAFLRAVREHDGDAVRDR